MKLPKALLPHVAGRSYTLDGVGRSGSTIALFDDRVLKVEPDDEESDAALRMMEWLDGCVPVPRVIASAREDGLCYMLMTRVTGEMACTPQFMRAPETLAGILADALRMLWHVPVADCPVRCTLDEKLRRARARVPFVAPSHTGKRPVAAVTKSHTLMGVSASMSSRCGT